MNPRPLPVLLIPGAWMGDWIWSDTVERLRRADCRAQTLTLPGLAPRVSPGERARVSLEDHVEATCRAVEAVGERLVLVGHSYSGIVAGMVADRLPDHVARLAVVAGFFPRHGKSLLDDWGSDAEERAAERADIERAGMLWAPPPPDGLHEDPGLQSDQVAWLARQLVPHPGRTITEPATMRRPVSCHAVTVVADVGHRDPRSTLPEDLAHEALHHWDFRSIPAGHWPMLSCPDELQAALIEAASHVGD